MLDVVTGLASITGVIFVALIVFDEVANRSKKKLNNKSS
jgi:hypothetical protein